MNGKNVVVATLNLINFKMNYEINITGNKFHLKSTSDNKERKTQEAFRILLFAEENQILQSN